MKKIACLMGLLPVIACTTAVAQSSVTMYGIVDQGVTYVSNAGGRSLWKAAPGVFAASRFGLKGSEDLGGGTQAIFTLENGFTASNGQAGQGSPGVDRLFGRQAFVGLASTAGTVTVGRQYDFMADLGRYASAGYVASLTLRPGTGTPFNGNNGGTPDFDRIAGARVDNAVKLVSASLHGFTLGALYGLGEQPGHAGRGSTQSFSARYAQGDFGAGLAYTDLEQALGTGHFRNAGAGASYRMGIVTVTGLYTYTRYTPTNDRIDVIEVGSKVQLSRDWYVGGAYVFMKPNHGDAKVVLRGKRHQLAALADYALSKRTDLYTAVGYQYAERGQAQMYNFQATDPGTKGQFIGHIGMRHFF